MHLALGPEDERVSRRHGELSYRHRQWWLRNIGRRPIRLPRGQMVYRDADPLPLSPGPTWLYVRGSGYRDHVVELFVTDESRFPTPPPPPGRTTLKEDWDLDETDIRVLVAVGQDYLHFTAEPRPWSYRDASELLRDIDPEGRWNPKKVENRITRIRQRIHHRGTFPYRVATCEGEPRPTDGVFVHNLLKGLVEEDALTPYHLNLLD